MNGVTIPPDEAPISGGVFFDAGALAQLGEFGTEREVLAGDVLYRAGDDAHDLYVVLEGRVDIVRPEMDGDIVIVEHPAGGFVGELNLLTGQRVYLTARVAEPGRVLEIPPQEFRRLMASKPDLADAIFQALEDRRELLRSGAGQRTVRIIGSRFSARRSRCGRSSSARAFRTSGSRSSSSTTSASSWRASAFTRAHARPS